MKKVSIAAAVALLLCAASVICLSISYRRKTEAEQAYYAEQSQYAAPGGGHDTSALYKMPANYQNYRSAVLLSLRDDCPPGVIPGALDGSGFEESEIMDKDFSVGYYYTVFAFDKRGKLLPNEAQTVISLKNGNTYIGYALAEFDKTQGKVLVTVHKFDLSAQLQNGTVDPAKVLTIGRVASTVFVTDGVNLDILCTDPAAASDNPTADELRELASVFTAAAGENYNYVCGYYFTALEF